MERQPLSSIARDSFHTHLITSSSTASVSSAMTSQATPELVVLTTKTDPMKPSFLVLEILSSKRFRTPHSYRDRPRTSSAYAHLGTDKIDTYAISGEDRVTVGLARVPVNWMFHRFDTLSKVKCVTPTSNSRVHVNRHRQVYCPWDRLITPMSRDWYGVRLRTDRVHKCA